MAQNELSEKIRAVAQAKGVDPELAVKIALAESGLNPAASAPKLSSAKGLFGVIDSTWKQFGGKPGQQANPDENIRVGTDVIASNTDFLRKNLGRDPSPSEIYAAHFFGPTGAKNFLAADMKAPAESVFSKEVLKANPQLQGKTVGDIRQMLAGKMGEKPAARTTQQAKTAPTDSEQMMKKALESGISAQVDADQLGSGYKAALALSFLGADEADEPEDENRLQARLDKEADDQQMAELAAYKPYNALKDLDLSSAPQVPVQRMAAGGLPFSPVPTVRQSARQQLDAIKADYDKYNTAAGDYNAALQKYKTEQYDPYVKAVEDYNKAAEVWNAGPRTTDFTGVMPTAPAEFSMTSPTAPKVSQADYEAMARSAQKDVAGRRLAIEAVSDPERFGLSLPKFFDKGGDVSAEQGLIPDEPTVRPVHMANKQRVGDREIQNMMLGLGVDQGMLGISLDKMKMGEKENLARNLMAMYNAKMGDLGVNAALIRPLDAPPGVYVGNIGASYPVGQGQIRAGVNAMRTPEGGTQTMGHSLGYSGQVGPGYLDAQIMQPKGYPQGRSAQVQYRIPFSHGGAVHRADGSPETGEVKEPWLPRVGTYSEKTAWEMYPGQMGQFDQQDAARHMLATGTLTRKYGETAAEMLGKLHEITTSPLRWIGSKMKLTQMPVDYEQDLHNNRVGIELGKRSKSQKDLEDLVQLEAERARNEQTPGTAWIGRPVRPVKRSDGSPETGEQIGPYIGNPNIQRQGAKARALAEKRDVNLLPDPKTYAAVAGLMGVPPNELGFSVLHPQYQQIQQVAEPAFVAGTALGIAPLAAPVVRGGARMVGSALNERMLAGQSLTPGINTPAPINFAVRPRGGPYLMQETGRGYKDPVQMALSDTQTGRDPALSKWFSDKFGAYMRRDMGSPDDQMVRAADEGRILHFAKADKNLTKNEVLADIPYHTIGTRKLEGFNPEGEARTAYGKLVEGKIDLPIGPVEAEGLSFSGREAAIPPAMRQTAINNPSMRFYELDPWIGRELKLEEMHDFMANMRDSNGVLKKYGQQVAIPKEYQFTDSSLQGLTPAQASERVALAEKWMQESSQKLASQAVAKNPGLISHTYPNGSKWASFPDLAEDSNLLRMVQDVGCDGGWCTKGEATALAYGSEEGKRLHILLDNKARPKAQITMQERMGRPTDFMNTLSSKDYDNFMQKYPEVAAVFESDMPSSPWRFEAVMDDVAQTPEFRKWASQQGARITEIKGVNNANDLTKAPFLSEIQDFVKRMDRQYGLQNVKNLEGIGMVDMSVYAPKSSSGGIELHDIVRRLNDGSMYAPEGMKDKLLEDAIQTFAKEVQGKSHGGLIERQNTDNRRYM